MRVSSPHRENLVLCAIRGKDGIVHELLDITGGVHLQSGVIDEADRLSAAFLQLISVSSHQQPSGEGRGGERWGGERRPGKRGRSLLHHQK